MGSGVGVTDGGFANVANLREDTFQNGIAEAVVTPCGIEVGENHTELLYKMVGEGSPELSLAGADASKKRLELFLESIDGDNLLILHLLKGKGQV